MILVGRLGQDPEFRNLENDSKVVEFSLATSEKYKKANGEQVEKTEWHNVKAFNRLAEVIAEYLKKGSQLYVEGKLETRSWDDQGGNKRYKTEVIVREMTML